MTIRRLRTILIICFILGTGLFSSPAIVSTYALTVEEMLAEPVLENRARNLSKKLRCLVCQNQSIDDSDADLAKDLRREVRTQLVAGKSDDAILSDLRAKYGDYVLLTPPLSGETLALWLAPVGFVVLGIAITLGIRRRAIPFAGDSISSSDRARIDAMKQQHQRANKRDLT